MKKYSQNDWLSLLSIFLIFGSFFCLAYLTPMQCDDFWYKRIGLTPSQHLHHYLTWSGRIIADYFSCALLQIPSHAIISAIISFFATGVCYLIEKIPSAINPETKIYWWKFIIIAMLYWIANPQIEDTTFWIVGACNYIVTSFFVLLFLYFLLKNRFSWWMIILSFVAGCSNENTCVSVVFLMSVLLLISRFENINSNSININLNKKNFLIFFSIFVVGALFLLLAPGNFERAQTLGYQKWRETSLLENFYEFITQFPDSLLQTSIAWKFYAILFGLVTIFKRKNKKEIVMSWEKNQRELAWSLLFLATALVSYCVLIVSPYFPERVLNPTLCFILLASSFLLNTELFQHKIYKTIFAIAVAWILFLFVKFFVILCAGHQEIMIQDTMRTDHINYVKEKKGTNITVDIPQHFISQILRRYKISFMFEFIPYGLEATWHGVHDLNHIPVEFDYSVLKTGTVIPLSKQSDVKNVKVYFQPKSFTAPQNTVIVESHEPISKDLFLQYTDAQTLETQEIEIDKQSIELQETYYRGITTEKDLDLKEAIIKTSPQTVPADFYPNPASERK